MDPALNPNPENPVINPPTNSFLTNAYHRKFIKVALGILGLLGLSVIGIYGYYYYQQVQYSKNVPVSNNTLPTRSGTPSAQPTAALPRVASVSSFIFTGPNDPSGKIFYAKTIQTLTNSNGVMFPAYSVYQADPNGANKKLLLTQGTTTDNIRDFKLSKERKLILLNLGFHVDSLNLTTGERKIVYQGQSGVDTVHSVLESFDHSKIALSIDNRESTTDRSDRRRIIVINTSDNSVAQTISVPSTVNKFFTFRMISWGKNNSVLYLYAGYEGPGELWKLDLPNNKFTQSAIKVGDVVTSTDQKWFAFSSNDAGNGLWARCVPYGTSSTSLQVTDTGTDATTVFESDPSLDLAPIRWSPDNKTLLFTSRKFISATGSNIGDCKITWDPDVTQLYLTTSASEQKVVSKDGQIQAWYSQEPKIVDGYDSSGKPRGLVVNGIVVEGTEKVVDYIGNLIP